MKCVLALVILATLCVCAVNADGDDGLPSQSDLTRWLKNVTDGHNAGFSLNMWASIVDRNGFVRRVTYTGAHLGDQWPGSRVISAQKANTANSFSLEAFSISTANLYGLVQPGGSLFGLQESNPIWPEHAYGGDSSQYGTAQDYLVGKKSGGVNVFGGGLALYNSAGTLLGGLGVSGDTSCTDHIVAWRLRHALQLDYVPAGFSNPPVYDNLVHGVGTTPFSHPVCDANEPSIILSLPTLYPTRHH